jgi:hypothetical protein
MVFGDDMASEKKVDGYGALAAGLSLPVIIALMFAVFAVLAGPIMFVWNDIMPAVFGLKVITWKQAFGLEFLLFLLSIPSAGARHMASGRGQSDIQTIIVKKLDKDPEKEPEKA